MCFLKGSVYFSLKHKTDVSCSPQENINKYQQCNHVSRRCKSYVIIRHLRLIISAKTHQARREKHFNPWEEEVAHDSR